jgi:hypothetical protein
MQSETEKCNSGCGNEKCSRPKGHKGKHFDFTDGISSWTDKGAERVNREIQEKQKVVAVAN